MSSSITEFRANPFDHYDGQVADSGEKDIVTRTVNESAGIPAGYAVVDVDGYSCDIPTTDDKPMGIIAREFMQDTPTDTVLGDQANVCRVGRIWVTVADGAAVGGAVYAETDTGAIVSTSSGNLLIVGARFDTAASAGGKARVQLSGN